jgi:hypothetical protein
MSRDIVDRCVGTSLTVLVDTGGSWAGRGLVPVGQWQVGTVIPDPLEGWHTVVVVFATVVVVVGPVVVDEAGTVVEDGVTAGASVEVGAVLVLVLVVVLDVARAPDGMAATDGAPALCTR